MYMEFVISVFVNIYLDMKLWYDVGFKSQLSLFCVLKFLLKSPQSPSNILVSSSQLSCSKSKMRIMLSKFLLTFRCFYQDCHHPCPDSERFEWIETSSLSFHKTF